jgi:hypothetical protein
MKQLKLEGEIPIIFFVFAIVLWVMGIAAAKGFWITLLAALLPPAAWVLAAQWMMGV